MIKMEIPNKWRGEILYTNDKICGDLINDGKYTGFAEIRAGKEFFLVNPFTLQKLAGYGKDGNEVYKSRRDIK